MIAYRHADPRRPFLWESGSLPPARWHGEGEGPVQYLSSTPDAAWAELLRHEEIRDEEDLATIRRALWVIEVPDESFEESAVGEEIETGGPETYPTCREEARRVRARVEAGAGPFAGARGVVCEAYEIHAGQTRVLAPGALRLFTVVARDGAPADALDGVGDAAGVVTGSYLHGVFASGALRRSLLGWLAMRAGRPAHPAWGATRPRSERWDRLADVVAGSVNLEAIGKLVGDVR